LERAESIEHLQRSARTVIQRNPDLASKRKTKAKASKKKAGQGDPTISQQQQQQQQPQQQQQEEIATKVNWNVYVPLFLSEVADFVYHNNFKELQSEGHSWAHTKISVMKVAKEWYFSNMSNFEAYINT